MQSTMDAAPAARRHGGRSGGGYEKRGGWVGGWVARVETLAMSLYRLCFIRGPLAHSVDPDSQAQVALV